MQPSEAIVALLSIVMSMSIPLLAIFLGYRKRKEMFSLYHQERMAAIEKGIDLPALPDDFFYERGRKCRGPSPHSLLLWGLVLILGSFALFVAVHANAGRTDTGGDPALFALIPGAIGVACLIYYFTVGKKLALAAEEQARLARATQASPKP